MPRKNSARGLGRSSDDEPPALRLAAGSRIEVHGGRAWHVQPISTTQALKVYRCPGCSGEIEEGVAHLVVWRADGVLGDRADLEARRHWHPACWRVA